MRNKIHIITISKNSINEEYIESEYKNVDNKNNIVKFFIVKIISYTICLFFDFISSIITDYLTIKTNTSDHMQISDNLCNKYE